MVEGDDVGVADMRSDAQLVVAVREGERDAFGQLVERWFDRCAEVAWRILHDRGRAAEVTQESLLAAWQQLDRLRDPEAFGGWLLRSTRNRALDRLARERRVVSSEERDLERGGLGDGSAVSELLGTPDTEVERRATSDLVWAASAALGPRDASLLDLHLRHGLEPGELAEELGITPNAAHQAMFRLRARLGDAIGAYLLWRGGEPRCVVLAAELVTAGLERFDAEVVALVRRHVDACVTCGEERARVTAPAAMFSAVPLLLLPATARAEVLAELARAGVPVPTASASPDAGTAGSELASVAGEPPATAPRDAGAAEVDDVADAEAAAGSVGPGASWRSALGRPRVLLSLALLVALGVLLAGRAPAWIGTDQVELAAEDSADTEMLADAPPVGDGPPADGTDGVLLVLPSMPGLDTLVPSLPPVQDVPAAGDLDVAVGGPSGDADGAVEEPAVTAPPATGDPSGGGATEDPPDEAEPGQPRPDDPPSEEPVDEEPPDEGPAPPAPSIGSFTLTAGSVCTLVPGGPPGWQQTAVWETTDAVTVTLTARGQTSTVPADGSTQLCLEEGDVATLTATGAGGEQRAQQRVAAAP
jgi:RNA polymerase sigma factor (sigma-70 family)